MTLWFPLTLRLSILISVTWPRVLITATIRLIAGRRRRWWARIIRPSLALGRTLFLFLLGRLLLFLARTGIAGIGARCASIRALVTTSTRRVAVGFFWSLAPLRSSITSRILSTVFLYRRSLWRMGRWSFSLVWRLIFTFIRIRSRNLTLFSLSLFRSWPMSIFWSRTFTLFG